MCFQINNNLKHSKACFNTCISRSCFTNFIRRAINLYFIGPFALGRPTYIILKKYSGMIDTEKGVDSYVLPSWYLLSDNENLQASTLITAVLLIRLLNL